MGNLEIQHVRHLLLLLEQKGVTSEDLTALIRTGILSDIFEAIKQGFPIWKNRQQFRKILGLSPFILEKLECIRSGIDVSTPMFKKEWFDTISNRVRMGDEFKDHILYKVFPDKEGYISGIHESNDILRVQQVISDSEMRKEIGDQEYSSEAILAKIKALISPQLKGEEGNLAVDGRFNILGTVETHNGRKLVVYVRFDTEFEHWLLLSSWYEEYKNKSGEYIFASY